MTSPGATAPALARLEASGIDMVIGTVVNPAGLTHAKAVPLRRLTAFGSPGLGASPVWHGFTIDKTGIVFPDGVSVVGDQRIRLDFTSLRALGDGLAWAPGEFFEQDGSPVEVCSRGTLGRVEARLADAGLAAQVGHEIEFVLTGPDGGRLPADLWAQYGLAGLLEHEGFVHDVMAAAAVSGVGIEQMHPEYGANQFEISLAPLPPVAAADQLVLARTIVGRVARRHGMRVSFSPVPFAGSVGSGAHQHFSLSRADASVFGDGPGTAGMTAEGEHAVAGVLRGLPDAVGLLSGSILSGLRLQPGFWSGAYACWGTENREAAVRFLAGGPGNPQGANVEVKPIDPSANPYFATAAILGLALDGIADELPLPAETVVDPAGQSDDERGAAGTVLLPSSQTDALDALDRSARLRAVLGDRVVDTVVAVRRYEHDNFGELDATELADRFRLAWSV